MAQAPGIPEFGLKSPPVGAVVDQLGPIVLTRWSYDPKTYAQDGFLLPRLKFSDRHCWTTFEIHRETKSRIQETRPVNHGFVVHKFPVEIP